VKEQDEVSEALRDHRPDESAKSPVTLSNTSMIGGGLKHLSKS
jgi:hypothetical protein